MFRRRPSKVAYSLVLWVLLLAVIGSTPGFGAAARAEAPQPEELVGVDSGWLVTMDSAGVSLPAEVAGVRTFAWPAAARMSEGFEGNWPASGWQVVDNSSSDDGEYLFGKRTCHPRTGSSAGWAVGGGAQGGALGCTGNYPNNAYTWAVYGPVDLSTATAASLTFHVWGRTQASQGNTCLDYLFAGSSTDKTNFTGGRWCGNATGGDAGNGYYKLSVDLAGRLGASRVWIAFAFLSDGSTTDVGFTIDDVALDVAGAGPAPAGRAVYLPLITKPPKDEAPPAGTAFEWIKRTLNTPGAQENFVLDTSRCTFSSASGYAYVNGATAPYTRDQAEANVLSNLKEIYFRASLQSLFAEYKPNYLGTAAQVSIPEANRLHLRVSFTPQGTDRADVIGDVVQNEMRIMFEQNESSYGLEQYTAGYLKAELRCPISRLPTSEWKPLSVSHVQVMDLGNPSRCFRVRWQPATADLPGAPAAQYALTLWGGNKNKGTVYAPGSVSEYDDCSAAAQAINMCIGNPVVYQVRAVSAAGKRSVPAESPQTEVWRLCW